MEWITDTAANKFKNSYFDDINETGTTLDISGNLNVRHGNVRAKGIPPIGSITFWSGTINEDNTVPDYENWRVCDGTNGTPDLRGRFIVGTTGIEPSTTLTVGTESATYNLEQTGGEASVTLVTDNLSSHTHISNGQSGGHNHSYNVWEQNDHNWNSTNYSIAGTDDFSTFNGEASSLTNATGTSGNHNHGGATDATGSGQAHDNMPPYYVLAYIMRIS